MPVLPGSEPYGADRGPTGVVLSHGFTGSPVSIRPWAEHLAAAGLTVRAPLLPGHGTRWQDLNATRWPQWYAEVDRAFAELSRQCEQVFVGGLSMGGTLALRLAALRPGAVAGVVVVNPSLDTADPRAWLLPYVSKVWPALRPVGDDIKRPDTQEGAYDRLPLRAAASLQQLWRETRSVLGRITAPVLAFRSVADHVVPATSMQIVRAGATATTVTERVLHDSFHVATLDNDAPLIFAETVDFIRSHASARAAAP